MGAKHACPGGLQARSGLAFLAWDHPAMGSCIQVSPGRTSTSIQARPSASRLAPCLPCFGCCTSSRSSSVARCGAGGGVPPSITCPGVPRQGGSQVGCCGPGEGWVLLPLRHVLFTVWATRRLCSSPQDTLNNNSLGKKHSWQERVSRSSSPLKTGEFSGCWPGAAPRTLLWLSGAWGKWCRSRRLGKHPTWM